MKKIHVAAVAVLLGLAAALGTFAAIRTASLGAASRHAADTAYSARVRQLDAYSAKLKRELAAKPARLQAPAAAAAGTPRVVYRRPPAIVVVKHSRQGDDGLERADGGGGND